MKKQTFSRRVYTPQFSLEASASVRRLAWALNKPMTTAIGLLVSALPAIIDPSKVCLACRDCSACASCVFCQQVTADKKPALLAAL